MATKQEELMESIQPSIKLTKAFFLRIYGHAITNPQFADQALDKLESIGALRAREHYNNIVNEYETKHNEELKQVAKWFRKECEKEWENRMRKEVSKSRTEQKEVSQLKRKEKLKEMIRELESH